MTTIWIADHYHNGEFKSLEPIRAAGWTADEMNWLFCSTSGVHGSYTTLDEAQECLQRKCSHVDSNDCNRRITVLIVRPRLVSCFYGHVEVTLEDIAWLRARVWETLKAVEATQRYNT